MIRSYSAAYPVLVFLLFAWPKYWLFPMPGGFAISPFSLLTLAMLAVFAATFIDARVRSHAAAVMGRHRAVFLLYLAWVLWRFTCDLLGQTPQQSMQTTLRSMVYGESILLLGLIALPRRPAREAIPSVLLLVVIFTTIIGAYEWSVQRTFPSILGLSFAGLDENAIFSASRQAMAFYRDGAYRAASIFSHSIVFAQFAGALAPLAVHTCRFGRGGIRVLGVLALCCIPVVMAISGARSGFVVLVVALGAYGLLNLIRVTPQRVLACLATFAIAALVLASPLQAMIGQLTAGDTIAEQMSTNARTQMLANGLRALEDRPLIGYGDGRSPDIAGLVGRHNIRTIDNLYLSAAVDFGIVGLALLLCLLGAAFAAMSAGLAKAALPLERNLQSAYLAAAIAVAVGQTVITIPDNMALIYLLTALAVTRPGPLTAVRQPGPDRRPADAARWPAPARPPPAIRRAVQGHQARQQETFRS